MDTSSTEEAPLVREKRMICVNYLTVVSRPVVHGSRTDVSAST